VRCAFSLLALCWVACVACSVCGSTKCVCESRVYAACVNTVRNGHCRAVCSFYFFIEFYRNKFKQPTRTFILPLIQVHECARHSVRFGKFDSFYFCLLFYVCLFLCLFVCSMPFRNEKKVGQLKTPPSDRYAFQTSHTPLPQKVTPPESLACVTLHGVSIVLTFTCGMVFSIFSTRLFVFAFAF